MEKLFGNVFDMECDNNEIRCSCCGLAVDKASFLVGVTADEAVKSIVSSRLICDDDTRSCSFCGHSFSLPKKFSSLVSAEYFLRRKFPDILDIRVCPGENVFDGVKNIGKKE